MMKCLILFFCIFFISACGDSDKPSASISDTTQVYSPQAMDDDDALLNAGVCRTYYSTRKNAGDRILWKITNPPWRRGTYASVSFSSGFRVPRVIVGKANRINSGKGRGFVFRPGESTKGIIAIWSPYGDHSNRVTVCGR